MLFWEIRNKETGRIVSTEMCPGNAAEHLMILDEIKGRGIFEIVEVDEVEGA